MNDRKISKRVRGSHRCADGGGTYDLERNGEEVFCTRWALAR